MEEFINMASIPECVLSGAAGFLEASFKVNKIGFKMRVLMGFVIIKIIYGRNVGSVPETGEAVVEI